MKFKYLRILSLLAVLGCLVLTGCDLADVFAPGDDGTSDAQQVLSDVQPYAPAGPIRAFIDLALLAASITSSVLARKAASKELAKTEAREYTHDEAESMLAAIERLKKAGTSEDK